MAKEFIDQLHQTIRLDQKPHRIVSLVPSQTELLANLGLEQEVVGITKFCIYPEKWFNEKKRVGGTKTVDIEKVRQLQPDLIIGNKEENTASDIQALQSIAPVWMSDIETFEDALNMIQSIGAMCEKQAQATQLIQEISAAFIKLQPLQLPKSVLYFIWDAPKFVAGKNTFIDAMLQKCGLINYSSETRYPEWNGTTDAVDIVFLSSEPFPFKESHLIEFQNSFPSAKIVLVDGEYFSWYGSRLTDAPRYFEALIQQLT
jgi:ABC-type Fe3+-hydroxamate transport system substrate-binding protein